MTGPVGNKNRAIALAVRELVSSYMQSVGFDTTPKPYYSRVSESLETALVPDVDGIDGVHIDVSSRLTHRLSDDLDSARRAGSINGAEISAFVQYRPEREISESYVVTSLRDFAKLLHAADKAP